MSKVALALCTCEGVEQVFDASPQDVNGALIGLSEQGLELGKDHFDGVQVWAVGREEQPMGPSVSDQLSGGQAFVAAESVGVDDIAGSERRGEILAESGG